MNGPRLLKNIWICFRNSELVELESVLQQSKNYLIPGAFSLFYLTRGQSSFASPNLEVKKHM